MTGTGGRPPESASTPTCGQVRVLLMGYLDDELDAPARRRVEDHLAVCVSCRREERSYRRLGEVTEMAGSGIDTELGPDEAWAGIYGRIERGLGWILLSIGMVLLGGFGLWHLLQDFLLSSEEPLVLRVGVGALVAGGLVLLVSFVREKLWHDSHERYREVQR
ncbi:MAG: anti-sigma factor family protein [Acidobacteriota bacterium]